MKIMGISLSLVLMLLLAASYAGAGVVVAYQFDGSGNTVVDSSGNGNDGTLAGGATRSAGKFGTALELNGTDAWVDVPGLGTFDQVTIATWGMCTGRVGDWRVIYNVSGWSAGWVHHQFYGSNVLGFSLHSNPGGNDSQSAFTIGDSEVGVWHHFATVYDSGGPWVRFYLDGELDVQNDWGGNPAVLEDPGTVGAWNGERQWEGLFDDFVIYDTALDQGAIQSLMNGSLTSVEPTGKLAISWGSIKE